MAAVVQMKSRHCQAAEHAASLLPLSTRYHYAAGKLRRQSTILNKGIRLPTCSHCLFADVRHAREIALLAVLECKDGHAVIIKAVQGNVARCAVGNRPFFIASRQALHLPPDSRLAAQNLHAFMYRHKSISCCFWVFGRKEAPESAEIPGCLRKPMNRSHLWNSGSGASSPACASCSSQAPISSCVRCKPSF